MNFIHKLHQTEELPWKNWFLSTTCQDLGDVSSTPTFLERIVSHCLPLYRSLTRCSVHNGLHTSLWFDHWTPEGALYTLFPALFSHCTRPHVSIHSAISHGIPLRPRLSAAAAAELSTVQSLLVSLTLDQHPDTRSMAWGDTLQISSRAIYRVLATGGRLDSSAITCWGTRLPSKIKIFCYLADIDRVSTRVNLLAKGCGTSDTCASCSCPEDSRHIFFDCSVASDVWRLLGVTPVPGSSIWDLRCPIVLPPQVWRLTIAAILWSLWKARNSVVFDNKPTLLPAILRRATDDVALWSHRFAPEDRIAISTARHYLLQIVI
jgi:hypothetical protein